MFRLITCWVVLTTKNLNDLKENRVIMNSMWKKIASISLSVFLLVSVNFCLAECACAASEHHHGEEATGVSGRHDEADECHHSTGSEKHDAGGLCCSSLVSDQVPSGNSFGHQPLKNQALTSFVTAEPLFVISPLNHPQYRAEFPPGTSPPAVFLSTYFTHAPPAIL